PGRPATGLSGRARMTRTPRPRTSVTTVAAVRCWSRGRSSARATLKAAKAAAATSAPTGTAKRRTRSTKPGTYRRASGARAVGGDAPPLRDHGGEGREAAVEEDELGHAARRPGPRSHGDAGVGQFEREHVVDAVPGHGDGVAARLERPH